VKPGYPKTWVTCPLSTRKRNKKPGYGGFNLTLKLAPTMKLTGAGFII